MSSPKQALSELTNVQENAIAKAWDTTPLKKQVVPLDPTCPSQTRSSMKMRTILEDQGFRKDVARNAAVHCKADVSQAIQYALDYQCALYDSEEDEEHNKSAGYVNCTVGANINKKLVQDLIAQGFHKSDAKRAACRCNTVESAINYLFDGERLRDQAAKRAFKCEMCMEDEIVSAEIITLNCEHRFCKECLKMGLEMKLKEKSVSEDDLCCPFQSCKQPFDVHIIEALLSQNQYQMFLDLKLRKVYARQTREIRECPKCSYLMAIEDDDDELLNYTVCPRKECGHAFCGRCGEKPHVNQTDLNLSCEQYADFLQMNDEGLKNFRKFMEQEGLRQCPKCRNVGELKSGCKFVYCPCKANYCYLCGRELLENQHYSHFVSGPYGEQCYGGRPDKKLRVAEPKCKSCEGNSCKLCAEKIQQKIDNASALSEHQMIAAENRKRLGFWGKLFKGHRKKK